MSQVQLLIVIVTIALCSGFAKAFGPSTPFLPTLKSSWRILVVSIFGIAGGAFQAFYDGQDANLLHALATGFAGAAITLITELINALNDSSGTAKTARTAARVAAKIAPLGLLLFVMLAGCSAGNVVCPVIHAADELCPWIVVVLQDGGTLENGGAVKIPKTDVRRIAQEAAQVDAGAR